MNFLTTEQLNSAFRLFDLVECTLSETQLSEIKEFYTKGAGLDGEIFDKYRDKELKSAENCIDLIQQKLPVFASISKDILLNTIGSSYMEYLTIGFPHQTELEHTTYAINKEIAPLVSDLEKAKKWKQSLTKSERENKVFYTTSSSSPKFINNLTDDELVEFYKQECEAGNISARFYIPLEEAKQNLKWQAN